MAELRAPVVIRDGCSADLFCFLCKLLLVLVQHRMDCSKISNFGLVLRGKSIGVFDVGVNASFHQVVDDSDVPPMKCFHQRGVAELASTTAEIGAVQVQAVEDFELV